LTVTRAVTHNIRVTIRNCRDRRTADFLAGKRVRQFEACSQKAIRALTKLQAATRLYDLRNPPSNRFEALGGSRSGEYSIRIDGQWRVCFRWATLEALLEGEDIGTVHGEPYDVEINNHYS
jgi:toxin HigB-1